MRIMKTTMLIVGAVFLAAVPSQGCSERFGTQVTTCCGKPYSELVCAGPQGEMCADYSREVMCGVNCPNLEAGGCTQSRPHADLLSEHLFIAEAIPASVKKCGLQGEELELWLTSQDQRR